MVQKLEIENTSGGHTYKVVLTTQEGEKLGALFEACNASTNSWNDLISALIKEGKKQRLLEEVMLTTDGKPDDGLNGDAAYWMFDKETHLLAHTTHFTDGVRTIARTFNEKGHVNHVQRFRDDYLNDGPKGEPSVEIFDDHHKRTYLEHNTHGRLNDTDAGEPARQWFENGKLVKVGHFKDGDQVGETETPAPVKKAKPKAKAPGM